MNVKSLMIIAATALAVGVCFGIGTASAVPNCIQDVWMAHGNTQGLNCTAKDVQLSQVMNIDISAGGKCEDKDGVRTCTCYEGGNVTFTADFYMLLTAQDRYDIGFYIATDGDSTKFGALEGTCDATSVSADNSPTYFQIGDEQQGDLCGDISGPAGSPYNPQIVRATVTMPCIDNGKSKLALPYCTTWRQPGSNQLCDNTGDLDDQALPETIDFYPGSPSKCFCDLREIDIFTEVGSWTVLKSVSPSKVAETGGSVVYSVSVRNTSEVSSILIDSLTDDLYGDITTSGHNDITATTCIVPTTIPAGVAEGNPYDCEFTVAVGAGNAGKTVTDRVYACGCDDFGNCKDFEDGCPSDDAEFTYDDLQTEPTLDKSAISYGNVACSVDVTYKVLVTNNSPVDILTLTSLDDDVYGSLTDPSNAKIDQSKNGCLAAAGHDINPLGTYSCNFVGKVDCAKSQTKDTVTASARDDDAKNWTPFDDATVNTSVTVEFP